MHKKHKNQEFFSEIIRNPRNIEVKYLSRFYTPTIDKEPKIKASNQDYFKTTDNTGATSQIRTGDPRITSAVLWPAELKWQLFNW